MSKGYTASEVAELSGVHISLVSMWGWEGRLPIIEKGTHGGGRNCGHKYHRNAIVLIRVWKITGKWFTVKHLKKVERVIGKLLK